MSGYEIIFSDMSVQYTIRRRRLQKRVNLIVHQDGSLVVTAPKNCSIKFIEKSIYKNEEWILKQVSGRQKNITIDERVIKHIRKIIRPTILFKLEEFNRYYGFSYGRVSIRNQRSRWGSCSSEGNLNFNCKLLCVRDELRDYVVVHELCHLKEMNHSKNFWALVAETIPNYKELRKELKNVNI